MIDFNPVSTVQGWLRDILPGDIYFEILNSVDSFRMASSSCKNSILMLNLTPFQGIISFTEPAINIETEMVYTQHQLEPVAIIDKNITIEDGTIEMTQGSFYKARNFGVDLGKYINITKIVNAIHPVMDFREIRFFENVLVKGVSTPTLNSELMYFTVELSLQFTKMPKVIVANI